MSGGSYAACDGCYEKTDHYGKTIFLKPDKSRFLAQDFGGIWACYEGQLLGKLSSTGGDWFERSMY